MPSPYAWWRVVTPAAVASLTFMAGCIDVEVEGRPPVAEAGPDQSFPDEDKVTVTLDGTGSHDVDGTIVDYEWRYTGDPRGDAAPAADDDAGVAEQHPANEVLETLGLDLLPSFCPVEEPDPTVIAAARWCELEPKGEAEVTIDLDVGVYRFTLWVTDDDGMVSTDSVVIHVGVP